MNWIFFPGPTLYQIYLKACYCYCAKQKEIDILLSYRCNFSNEKARCFESCSILFVFGSVVANGGGACLLLDPLMLIALIS